MTNFRTSSAALDVPSGSPHGRPEFSPPVLPAEYLAGHPGTTPTLTVPARFGQLVDVESAWEYLAETADFFAVAMPTVGELRDACARFLLRVAAHPLVAMHVTVVVLDGSARALVTGAPVRPAASTPVRIDVSDGAFPLARPIDPPWRKMAARTTSRAVEDRLRRRLSDRGCVDGIGIDALPFLGALVFDRDGRSYGLDNPEPTSILDMLGECGAVADVRRTSVVPHEADRAWWISPDFATHPVSAVGATTYRVDAAAPAFARCA